MWRYTRTRAQKIQYFSNQWSREACRGTGGQPKYKYCPQTRRRDTEDHRHENFAAIAGVLFFQRLAYALLPRLCLTYTVSLKLLW